MIRLSDYRITNTMPFGFHVEADLDICGSRRVLYYDIRQFGATWALRRPVTADFAAVALLPEAMARGCELRVDAPVSRTLLSNLHYFQLAYQSLYPALGRVALSAPAYDTPGHDSPGLTGQSFSCGIDSFCTLLDNVEASAGAFISPIDFLLFANVGAHGHGNSGHKLFQLRLRRVQEVARSLCLPVVVVDSNIDDLCTLRFEDSHAARTLSCVHVLQCSAEHYLLPSTNCYRDLCADGSTPLTDHLLSSSLLRVVHDGAQYTRVEKSLRIARSGLVHKYLNVCTRFHPAAANCSECDKCARAMLTFDMLELRAAFSAAFNWANFEATKKQFVAKMAERGIEPPNFYWREIVHEAERRSYNLFG